MIPLLHDFDGETVLVAGGGTVGARKARRFASEARTVVVAPEFADADFGDSERIRATLAPESVDEWFDRTDPALVVAATNDTAVNDALETEARDRGLLINRADHSGDRDPGSVVVPATVRDDPVVAAVATGGTSPALSRYLRQQIEPILANAGGMASLTGDLRAELKDSDLDPQRRRDAMRAVVRSDDVWTDLDRGSANERATAEDVISATTGEPL